MGEAELKKFDIKIKGKDKMEAEGIKKPRVAPEVALGSKKAPEKTQKLDGDKNVYEPKMFKRDGDYPSQGEIHIVLYPHKEFDVTFKGTITGSDVNRAWRMMLKNYRLWKVEMAKKIDAEREKKLTEARVALKTKKPRAKKKVEVNR